MNRPPRPAAVVAGLLAVTVVLLVPLMAGDENFPKNAAGSAAAKLPAPGGRPCGRSWSPAVEIGRIPGQRKEVSGFVSSARYPGLAWMVRDSGNPAVLYSFELEAGEHRIRSRAFPVRGASNGDWEDLAYTTGADGRGRLWIVDNINRHTAPKTLWEILEPEPDHDGEATIVGRYRWAYPDAPDGNYDTETGFFLGGKLVVVSKTEPSRVYRFDQPLDPSAVNRPALVATVPAGVKMTLGSTSADERLLVTSSTRNQTAWVYANRHDPPDVSGFFDAPPLFSRRLSRPARGGGLLPLRRLRHRAPLGAAERVALEQPELTAGTCPAESGISPCWGNVRRTRSIRRASDRAGGAQGAHSVQRNSRYRCEPCISSKAGVDHRGGLSCQYPGSVR